MDCIFCKIIAGEIPCAKVSENEKVISFMDINPVIQGHMLVVPKTHSENLFEIREQDLEAVIKEVKRCAGAVKNALDAGGVTLLQLNGKSSDQIIPHLHVHIIPRWEDDGLSVSRWGVKKGDMEKIKITAEKIRDSLSG